MKTLKPFLLLLILLISCGDNTTEKNNRADFKEIHFQFYPAFIPSSTMVLNMSDSSVIFRRIGMRKYYYRHSLDSFAVKKSPSSFYFKLNNPAYRYLKDSISFNKEDFIDREVDAKDGIYENILFVKNNGNLIDIDLFNDMTDNHRKLISKLLEEAKDYAPDSLTYDYLIKLRKYHKDDLSLFTLEEL